MPITRATTLALEIESSLVAEETRDRAIFRIGNSADRVDMNLEEDTAGMAV
jgi:hypothetical protein